MGSRLLWWPVGLVLLGAWGGLSVGRAQLQPPKVSGCEACHSKEAAEHKESAHAKRGITCVDCHGGDPNDMEETAMSPAKGFKGRIPRRSIPEFCASCHSRRDLMRPFGLPTSQYEEYLTSQHGQALLRGNTEVAVCTDCHRTHAIFPVDDPRSSVYATRLPATCSRCHSDPKMMAKYRLPTDIFEKYRRSVHGQSLMEGGNLASPNCASCHGSHGAAPPGVRSVEFVCGRCHTTTEEAFREGPHQEAANQGKMSPCISCHRHHDIEHPTHEMLRTLCTPCHTNPSNALEVGEHLYRTALDAERRLERAKALVQQAKERGLVTSEWEGMLQDAHTNLLQLAVAQHSLAPHRVEQHAAAVVAVEEDIQADLSRWEEQIALRRLALLFLWFYLGAVLIALFVKRWRVERPRQRILRQRFFERLREEKRGRP